MVINDDTVCTDYSKGQKWSSTIEWMTGTIDKTTGTIVTVSKKTVAIPNIGIKVSNRRSKLPKRNFLRSLTQPRILIQRTFKLTDIEYDQIKDKTTRMEHVDYNIDIKINVMNVYDMEDFSNI